MVTCPKCGSSKIIGPKYEQKCSGKWGENEGLRYTCYQCGYSEIRPTRDSEQALKECQERVRRLYPNVEQKRANHE